MKKFLLVDDHQVVRSGIRSLLLTMFKPAEIEEAPGGDEAVAKLKKNSFDLVLMDVQMPNTDSLGLVEYICTQYPGTNILMFSMSAENIYAKRFLKAGAKGFLSKDASADEIAKAINLTINGRRYISESLANLLAEESVADRKSNPFDGLSKREFEIVSLLLAGNGISDISKALSLQVSTVGTYKARLFEKLNISNILELKELATSYNI
ncbi:response regulator [Ferruginibacter albus]|uniref:response regulator n=1 Tax=Ferruginibacter albus TaxID=2875540 RepID=UPI001CC41F52|nr:response regulator transcription factor [Ferruginibacter albus]UAY51541.1 response regulator transcription factor [Ferruginibacter albus]